MPKVEVWPENEQAVKVFEALSSQWRMGPAGPVAIDYCAIPPVFDLLGVERSEWSQLFHDLRVMEAEAINLIRSKRRT